MSSRFIKFHPDSQEAQYLIEHHPNAFLLLTIIATRARRIEGKPDGIHIGEALIGDYQAAGIDSRKKYRTALKILIERNHIEKIETCRNRGKTEEKKVNAKRATGITTKRATGITTIGTRVKLLKSDIYDINSQIIDDEKGHRNNHQEGHRGATEGPRTRTKRNEKESSFKKETNKEKVVPFDSSFSRSSVLDEQEETILAYCQTYSFQVTPDDIKQWLKKYPKERIIANISYSIPYIEKMEVHVRWIQNAIAKDYAGIKKLEELNRIFTEDFKKENDWNSLTITAQYCRDEDTGKDFFYKIPIYQKLLKQAFQNKEANTG